ncbi:hypothetical protein FA13DRAFT_1819586, partial [Coprinellus micaceus]
TRQRLREKKIRFRFRSPESGTTDLDLCSVFVEDRTRHTHPATSRHKAASDRPWAIEGRRPRLSAAGHQIAHRSPTYEGTLDRTQGGERAINVHIHTYIPKLESLLSPLRPRPTTTTTTTTTTTRASTSPPSR